MLVLCVCGGVGPWRIPTFFLENVEIFLIRYHIFSHYFVVESCQWKCWVLIFHGSAHAFLVGFAWIFFMWHVFPWKLTCVCFIPGCFGSALSLNQIFSAKAVITDMPELYEGRSGRRRQEQLLNAAMESLKWGVGKGEDARFNSWNYGFVQGTWVKSFCPAESRLDVACSSLWCFSFFDNTCNDCKALFLL